MTNETKTIYRVRGVKGTWEKVFTTPEIAKEYCDHIRERYDKTANVYKVTEIWEVCYA